jgi:hypothetical protein
MTASFRGPNPGRRAVRIRPWRDLPPLAFGARIAFQAIAAFPLDVVRNPA